MRSGLLSRMVAVACRTQYSRFFVTAVMAGSVVPGLPAQELTPQLGQPQDMRPAETGRIQFYGKQGQTYSPTATAVPQPYQRTGSTAPLKNYYTELFGTQPAPTAPSATVQHIPSIPGQNSGTVLHAAYEQAEETSGVINTVAGEVPVKTAELPEWARDMKSRAASQTSAAPTPATTAAATQPVLTITGQQPETTQPLLTPEIPQTVSTSAAPEAAIEIPVQEIAAGPQAPSVKIEWKAGSDINVGQECECELQVTNVGTSSAYGVKVTSTFPATVRLLSAEPQPTVVNSALVWELGQLEESATKTIKVKMIPSQRGPLAATAQVHFTGAAQSAFVVREPMLGLMMDGPEQVMIGDPASHSVTINNPGNGIAKNVQLEAIIPAGLEHSRGERLIMEVGSLNPGESRTIRLALAAVAGGQQSLNVTATAEGGLLQRSESVVSVIAPSLQAEIDGPGLRYKGRNAVYTLRVTNDGSIATSNVRLMHKVPDGFRFVSASRGAAFDQPTRILSWFVGKLDAGKSAEMQVELSADQIGEFVHYIRATSEHGSTTDSQLMTRVEGSSALMLEIADLDDPVEVGNETAYEIKILNEGSAAAQDVGLSCELPAGVQLVKAEGPAQHVVDGNLILFQPLPKIEAGKSARFLVHVVGNIEGNLRFRARMTSATAPEPLTFEELTRFYGDQR